MPYPQKARFRRMLHGWQHLTPEDREAILRGIADGGVYGGPYHIELDWVDRCNARCFFCNSTGVQNGASLTWERAETLVGEACTLGLRSIRLAGGGEPMLHPRFTDLLALLAARGVVLDNLTTNGMLLTESVVESLARARVAEIRVSLNYCDEEQYARAMGVPARFFGRTVDGMKRLDAARRLHPNIERITTQFFVHRPTAHQIAEMYRLGRELGVDAMTFRELSLVDADQYYTAEQAPEILAQLRDIVRDDWTDGRVELQLFSHGMWPKIRELYNELHAELGGPLPAYAPRDEQYDYSDRYCYIGWYSMMIMGSQSVFPCCYLMPHPTLPPLESVAERGIDEVWRGPGYTRFRREMREFMLNRRRSAFFQRRMKTIPACCQSHDECPLSPFLADSEFYAEADRRLQAQRSRPVNRGRSLVNRAALALERLLRK